MTRPLLIPRKLSFTLDGKPCVLLDEPPGEGVMLPRRWYWQRAWVWCERRIWFARRWWRQRRTERRDRFMSSRRAGDAVLHPGEHGRVFLCGPLWFYGLPAWAWLLAVCLPGAVALALALR